MRVVRSLEFGREVRLFAFAIAAQCGNLGERARRRPEIMRLLYYELGLVKKRPAVHNEECVGDAR
jgi:hypothetical protein